MKSVNTCPCPGAVVMCVNLSSSFRTHEFLLFGGFLFREKKPIRIIFPLDIQGAFFYTHTKNTHMVSYIALLQLVPL